MPNGQVTMVSLPYPSQWVINASIGRRPTNLGTLRIHSVTGNSVNGDVNFRGAFLPIRGLWNESNKQLTFESPYASFVGQLTSFDEPAISMRHYILSGRVAMKPPSIRAGEFGTWTATYNIRI
ncbi:hypothetical protein ACQCN2_18250 [Brevibacillus ginsengisoli]|uniref:hypothetical protein n=1 Tax=Brevibacillus ginsengisoli TaxID=363854 RepID=UPI003CEB483D